MYLTCSLAWLGKGRLSPQCGAQAPSFLRAENTFFLLQLPLCTALHSVLQVRLPLPLGCPLTLRLTPDSSVSRE